MNKRIISGLILLALIPFGDAFAYYCPEQGRWLSRDPIGEGVGPHLYTFVGNEPVGKVDRLVTHRLVAYQEIMPQLREGGRLV